MTTLKPRYVWICFSRETRKVLDWCFELHAPVLSRNCQPHLLLVGYLDSTLTDPKQKSPSCRPDLALLRQCLVFPVLQNALPLLSLQT